MIHICILHKVRAGSEHHTGTGPVAGVVRGCWHPRSKFVSAPAEKRDRAVSPLSRHLVGFDSRYRLARLRNRALKQAPERPRRFDKFQYLSHSSAAPVFNFGLRKTEVDTEAIGKWPKRSWQIVT